MMNYPEDSETESPESPEIAPESTESEGIGSVVVTIPEDMDLPDEGTITLRYKRDLDHDEMDQPGSVSLSIQSVDGVKPIDAAPEDNSPSASFDKVASQVRAKKSPPIA
jgi:hypothetical protein